MDDSLNGSVNRSMNIVSDSLSRSVENSMSLAADSMRLFTNSLRMLSGAMVMPAMLMSAMADDRTPGIFSAGGRRGSGRNEESEGSGTHVEGSIHTESRSGETGEARHSTSHRGSPMRRRSTRRRKAA
jgi:hypothetical protein